MQVSPLVAHSSLTQLDKQEADRLDLGHRRWWHVRPLVLAARAPCKFIILNKNFVIFDTKFIIFKNKNHHFKYKTLHRTMKQH